MARCGCARPVACRGGLQTHVRLGQGALGRQRGRVGPRAHRRLGGRWRPVTLSGGRPAGDSPRGLAVRAGTAVGVQPWGSRRAFCTHAAAEAGLAAGGEPGLQQRGRGGAGEGPRRLASAGPPEPPGSSA